MADPQPEIVFEGAHARAVCYHPATVNPQGARLVVAFDHRNFNREGYAPADPWQLPLSRGYTHLKVQVVQNDYYLNPDLADLRRALWSFSKPFLRVYGLGFSMGGFGALLLAKALRMDQAVLVSPQRLGFPKTPPYVEDMATEAAQYLQGGVAKLDGLSDTLRGVVLFDPYLGRGRDRAYANVVGALCPRLRLLALPGAGHPASHIFSAAKRYNAFQSLLFERRGPAAEFKALHREARQSSPEYEALLSKYLARRIRRSAKAG